MESEYSDWCCSKMLKMSLALRVVAVTCHSMLFLEEPRERAPVVGKIGAHLSRWYF